MLKVERGDSKGLRMKAAVWERAMTWVGAALLRARPLVSVYCDGSAHGRPGRAGGWAFVVVINGRCVLETSGAEARTTSNRMELLAALSALRAVISHQWHLGATVELVSDSRVALAVAAGQELTAVHDVALAQALRSACVEARCVTRWVRGHSGNPWNDRVDVLAGDAKQALVPRRVRRKAELRKGRPRPPGNAIGRMLPSRLKRP